MAPVEGASSSPTEHFTAGALTRNWHWTSIIFGLNHGCATTPLIFATTLLDRNAGYAGSALLYIFTCLGSLFLSVPIVSSLGQRLGMFFGMGMYCVYVASFAAAAAAPMGSWAQWALFMPGSAAGGVAASVLWTAQGSYIDRHATALLACQEGLDRQKATSGLAATFAVYYLVFEVVCKLFSSFALKLHTEPWIIFTICLILAVASALASLRLLDVAPASGAAAAASGGCPEAHPLGQFVGKLRKATALWGDVTIWLLAFTNFTFGFSAAFMNGYVNATFTKPQLGADYVGFYSAAVALVAAVFSHVFGHLSRALGTKGPFILIGSLCFLAIPTLVLLVGFDGWKYWLIVPYLLQGAGRAVYESTNKGVFADFFPGVQSEGAFANAMMQTTLSFAICFFFSATLPWQALAAIVMKLSALTFPGYLVARAYQAAALVRRRCGAKRGLDGSDNESCESDPTGSTEEGTDMEKGPSNSSE